MYEYEYDLILKPDYNTRGYTQWYYFRVSNTKAGKQYKFNIINLMKPDSLYNHGMRPLVYSDTEARRSGRGWVRGGSDICYYQNSMKRKNPGYYYTLTWSITFEHDPELSIDFQGSYITEIRSAGKSHINLKKVINVAMYQTSNDPFFSAIRTYMNREYLPLIITKNKLKGTTLSGKFIFDLTAM